MTNGEVVSGSSVKVDSLTDEVPSEGQFFTNESWALFNNDNYWIEAGQIGFYRNGIDYFFARENGHGLVKENSVARL
jgi:hypothetical protein